MYLRLAYKGNFTSGECPTGSGNLRRDYVIQDLLHNLSVLDKLLLIFHLVFLPYWPPDSGHTNQVCPLSLWPTDPNRLNSVVLRPALRLTFQIGAATLFSHLFAVLLCKVNIPQNIR